MQIIIYEIWESKNNNKYDKTIMQQHTIITKINAQLRISYKLIKSTTNLRKQ